MLRAIAIVFLLCLGGCQRPALVGANGVLRVTPSRVDFGDRWLRSRSRKTVEVANTGRAALTIGLTTNAPFEVAPSLTLGGGESVELELHFTPTALGPVEVPLWMEVDQRRHSVTLSGAGIEPPGCDSTRCRSATLDEVTARCVLSPLPDGEECSDACLARPHCEGGTCIGEPKRCDDGDRCTVDACDSVSGCAHAPVACRPSSPCMAARCDPAQGCVESAVVDGAACGEADCVSAFVCIQGRCVTRAVPDGAPCGPTSVCQSQGRCTAQVCVQAPATPLTRLWSYEVAEPRVHGLVADGTGNLFTVACAYAGSFRSQCSMLSLDPQGALRFRTPFPHITDTGSGGLWTHLVVAGDLVISAVEQSRLVAVDRLTGSVAWVADTRTWGLFPSSTNVVRPVSVGFDGAHTLVATLEGRSFGSITGSALVGLELSTGALTRSFALPAQGSSLVIDRAANLYLSHGSGGPAWEDTLTSFDAAWNLRWQRLAGPPPDNRIRSIAGTHGDQLFWAHPTAGEFTGVSDGSPLARPAPQGFIRGAVWNDEALFVLRQFCPPLATCTGFSDFHLEVLIVPADGSAHRQTTPLARLSWFTSLWLTDAGTTLLSLRAFPAPASLLDLDADGGLRMSCPLGLDNRRSPSANPVFAQGRYLLLTTEEGYRPRIDAWSLPGYAPASRGWVSELGGPGQGLRAR